MNLRQVHLDFHTSEAIPNIGKKFDKMQFQKMLKLGHVNSITVFSKCHHGWAYHPSKKNEMHPNLDFDLLKAQIDAAHEIGVKTPVYLSGGIDEKMARIHPEWLIRKIDGSTFGAQSFAAPGYHRICMNSGYLPYFLEQIEEVCENYDADGIFIDIVGVRVCYCHNCVSTLIREGKEPYVEKNHIELAERVYKNYTTKVREAVDKHKPGLPVFHNSGHVYRGRRDLAYVNTHLELESLPTGGWGYDHFPLSAAYARTLGMDVLGMTGKFHTSWGEFGGFKHPNALRYETALSIACGAGCSVGDQLHPSGEMDEATYSLIGEAYAEVEKKEPWLEGAVNISDIGVLSIEAAQNYYRGKVDNTDFSTNTAATDAGFSRIMLEGHYLFDCIDGETDFSQYKLIVLPDDVRIDDSLSQKLNEYVQKGGKILASGKSGMKLDSDEFALDFGAKCLGKAQYKPDYFMPEFEVEGLKKSAYVMYEDGMRISAEGGEVLGHRINPYFNREWNHFCSHKHTPPNYDDKEPGMICGNAGIYIAWNVFSDYATSGSIMLKKMVCHALDMLLGDNKTVSVNLPAQGVVTLTKQPNRQMVHLLYAAPVKRGEKTEIIEDLIPIYDTKVEVKINEKIESVKIVPENIQLQFTQEEGKVCFTVPKFECHQIVEIA